jgi:branched-chain amino acid transport system permease protein
MMIGIAPLANAEYHTSEMILVMTVIGGTGNLFASVLGSAFYLLLADWLSTLWPRWLLLLGLVLMAVSLWMQRGLWGLGQTIAAQLMGKRVPTGKEAIAQTSAAATGSDGKGEQA